MNLKYLIPRISIPLLNLNLQLYFCLVLGFKTIKFGLTKTNFSLFRLYPTIFSNHLYKKLMLSTSISNYSKILEYFHKYFILKLNLHLVCKKRNYKMKRLSETQNIFNRNEMNILHY